MGKYRADTSREYSSSGECGDDEDESRTPSTDGTRPMPNSNPDTTYGMIANGDDWRFLKHEGKKLTTSVDLFTH